MGLNIYCSDPDLSFSSDTSHLWDIGYTLEEATQTNYLFQ